jgi:hypothetical protein
MARCVSHIGEGRENGCPSQPFVPWFLIIGGSIIMCGLFLREILKRVREKKKDDICKMKRRHSKTLLLR